jgi:hypothetical protein
MDEPQGLRYTDNQIIGTALIVGLSTRTLCNRAEEWTNRAFLLF